MILKLFSIVVLVHVVQSNAQIPIVSNLLGGLNVTKVADTLNTVNATLYNTLNVTRVATDTVINTGLKIVESLIKTFSDFKTTFNKTYVDKAEELLREGIFNVSLALINSHNELYKLGNETYMLAMNMYGDWTHDEYLKLLGSKNQSDTNATNDTTTNNGTNPRTKRQTPDSGSCKFPTEKDWRKDGAVTPVKFQSQCGSCWAFAVVASLESHFFIKKGKFPNLSEQYLLDCFLESFGCNGGFPTLTYEKIMQYGIVDDSAYPPYVANRTDTGSCTKFTNHLKISGYEKVPPGDEKALKDAICVHGPVLVSVDASSDKFQFYKEGIYNDPKCSSTRHNHAMVAVGYGVDKKTNEPYWLVKNSYDTWWGEDGYIRYRRDFNNVCGIASSAIYPIS